MKLRDVLKTFVHGLLVEIQRTDGSPIITVPTESWMCLDAGLLSMPVESIGGDNAKHCGDVVSVRLGASWPAVYVSTAEELRAAMDEDDVETVVLTADITADSDQITLVTVNTAGAKYLDLNGYLLAAVNTEADEVIAIRVTGGGVLYIYDSEGCGEVYGGKYAKNNYAVWVDENTIVRIDGGYYTVGALADSTESSCTIYASEGSAIIRNGCFNNDNYSALNDSNTVLKGNIMMYGGVVVEQNPEEFLAAGKRLKESFRYYDHLYRVVGK